MQFLTDLPSLHNAIPSQAIVLCDENTARDCLPKLQGDFKLITIPSGEENKNLMTCEKVWQELVTMRADRGSHLLCLGGGVVCDLGAFVASTYMRGIDYTLVPTTLLAMVDASVGGKCGVDFGPLKNYIGLFSHPADILIMPSFLQTLSNEEWGNGCMEMIKHGLIADPLHFDRALHLLGDRKALTLADIKASVQIKEQHVDTDFNEQGIRKRLNFGHTVGHALESEALLQQKPISHGLAIAVGMLAEAYLSYHYWSLTWPELQRIEAALKPFVAEIDAAVLEANEVLKHMVMDKKNHKGDLMFSLIPSIGNAQENIAIDALKVQESLAYISSFK